MSNHREDYWRYLTNGQGGLLRMIEIQANDQPPSQEQATKLADYARRLREVAERFQTKPPAGTG